MSGAVALLRCWVREFMVGWHQGGRERAQRDASRHETAEQHWRGRREQCTHGRPSGAGNGESA